MKKILTLSIFLLILIPLFSVVTIPENVPDNIKEALKKNIDGREECDVSMTDFNISEDEIVSFVLSLDGKELKFSSPLNIVEDEIKSLLYYEDSLYSDGAIIEPINGSSYLLRGDEKYRKGGVIRVKDSFGKTQGIFNISKCIDEGALLTPFYLKSPLPGMRGEKSLAFGLSAKYMSTLKGGVQSVALSFSEMQLIYPLVPMVSMYIDFNQFGVQGIYGGLGIKTNLAFAFLFPKSPYLIRNMTLSAGVVVLFGYRKGFSFDARYFIDLDTYFTSFLSLNVGVTRSAMGYTMLSVGIGGRI